MNLTRRGWTVGALVAVLAVLAVVFARPILLAGSALLGAWLLAHQYRFTRDLERTVASLSVVQSTARTTIRTGDEMPVTLTVKRETETSLSLEITAGLPVGATTTEPIAVTLAPSGERADRTRTMRWPIAGRHSFDRATVVATDGLFSETITAGTTPTVAVEPPSPRAIHVGEGGDRIAASYGSHETGQTGSGIELAELREYVPGDTEKQIDWKATARHGMPYVREYEAETDRRTLLVVDHRASLATGPRAETQLEALREIALVIAGNARRLNDPLGLVTVGDGGITNHIGIASSVVNYGSVRRHLLELEPTAAATTPVATASRLDGPQSMGDATAASSATTGSAETHESQPSDETTTSPIARNGSGRPAAPRQDRPAPAAVRRSLADLEGIDDAFARTLRPFYTDREVYRERIAETPLYGAVERTVTNTKGSTWTVICTDDSRPAELHETVSLARRGGSRVTVLLAPAVLYEPGGLADLERAYDRYLAFEEFRRELAKLDDVTALEVGPADRLSAVLEAGRSRGGRA
ncbi:DUF58 domain-containing protein [Natrinema sp. DC36]|uniref:DUF58 domain-containing protein n=1 Tax=Natrinema sp. DC36 TaxID=2878680 RepID=UPI001CF0C0EF|nr:DUF58 domain-containing protein [Natrinema sp. DC36]